MDAIKDFFSKYSKPSELMDCAKGICKGEFGFSAVLALLCGSMSGNFSQGLCFAVFYCLWQSQFGARARGNPILSFADWLSGEGGPCDCVCQIVMQCLGWTFGHWFCGLMGQTVKAAEAAAGADAFASVVVQEMIASGFFVWLWLHIHDSDNKQKWSEFMGLAVGIAMYVAMAVKGDAVVMNPAQFFGAGERFQIFKFEQNFMWFVNFFAPIFAAFVSTLMYRWSKKE